MAVGDSNYVIFSEAKWVVNNPAYTIYMKALRLLTTKFNIISGGVFLYFLEIKNIVSTMVY